MGQSLLVQWFRELFSLTYPYAKGTTTIAAPEQLQRTLAMRIEEFDRHSTHIGGNFLNAYADVRYAAIAMADELLITNPWDHRTWWQQNLLEVAVLGTYVAGEEFFYRLDRILSERRSSEYTEVARVYLLCLLLGFRGKYRGKTTDAVDSYIARLYEYIFDRPYSPGSVHLNILSEQKTFNYHSDELKYFSPWYHRYLVLASIMSIALAFSLGIWLIITAPLRQIVDHIEAAPAVVVAPVQRLSTPSSPVLALTISAPGATDASIELYDAVTWEHLTDTTISIRTTAHLSMPMHRSVAIIAIAASCFPQLDTVSSAQPDTLERVIYLQPLQALHNQSIVLEHVSFEPGSAQLSIRSQPWLDALAKALASDTTFRIAIYGYTDNRGASVTNMQLSRMRAEQVATYLLQRGIAYERMRTFGMGERNPRAPNTTEEGRAKNRRVELVLSSQ